MKEKLKIIIKVEDDEIPVTYKFNEEKDFKIKDGLRLKLKLMKMILAIEAAQSELAIEMAKIKKEEVS